MSIKYVLTHQNDLIMEQNTADASRTRNVEYNGLACIVSTCSSCNSTRSRIPFPVELSKMTYITDDLTKYRERELGQR